MEFLYHRAACRTITPRLAHTVIECVHIIERAAVCHECDEGRPEGVIFFEQEMFFGGTWLNDKHTSKKARGADERFHRICDSESANEDVDGIGERYVCRPDVLVDGDKIAF